MSKLVKSFSWAMNGIRTVWREEVNFRIELIVGLGVVMLAYRLNFSLLEWIFIVGCIGAVIAAEMINTAFEDLCDKVEPKVNPAIGKIKDIMGGFVLIVSVTAVIIGLIIFSNYF